MAQHQVQYIGRFLFQLADFICLYAVFIQGPCGSPCGKYLITHCREPAGNVHCLFLVAVAHAHDHLLVFGQTDPGSLKCLVQRLVKGLCNAQTLACGLHLRPKADVGAPDFLKGEHGHLDGNVIRCRLKPRPVAQLPYGVSADNLGCQRNNGYACHLADIGHGT